MNKVLKFLIIAIITLSIPFSVSAKAVNIHLFYGKECPHCEDEQRYLETLKKQYKDNIKVNKYEVWYNKENSDLLDEVKSYFKEKKLGVPYTVIGNEAFMGYNENVANKIREAIKANLEEPSTDVVSYIKRGEEVPKNDKNKKEGSEYVVPFIGTVNAKTVSIPLVAAVIGYVDGINPCAMWVLLFLISMMIPMNNRKRMWVLGITFLLTSAIIYLFFMVAWLSVAVSALQQVLLRSLIALIAVVAGAINLRSFLKDLKDPDGCRVVDDKKRLKILNKIKDFTTKKSFILAMLGVITLAISVNLVELACSAGLPLLFTSILAINDLSLFEYCLNLFIYIFFFLINEIVIFIIAMKTMQVTGISTKYSKYSHLIGGILMLLIGALLLFKPEWIMFNF